MQSTDELKVYPFRWFILAMFCCLEISNALLWVTFAPISDIAGNYFGGGYYGSTTSVNMLANIYLILYGPGTIMSIILMKYCKPKQSMIIAGSLNLLGAFIRYIASANSSSIGFGTLYILIMIGQSFAAISQPFFVNCPPMIAATWFPVNEREMATTIGSVCSPVGNAIGQLIPVYLVAQQSKNLADDDSFNVTGMSDLLLAEFVICIVPVALTIAFFQDAPLTAPSQSTKIKVDRLVAYKNQTDDDGNNESELQQAMRIFYLEALVLFYDRDFMILFITFSISIGFINALLTLLSQIIAPFGYSDNDAATFATVLIVFGLIGAGANGIIMERTKAYRTVMKSGVFLSILATLFFVAMLYSNNYWPLMISMAILGFLIVPLPPVMMENCAECTYPISEEFPLGILYVESDRFGPPPLLPSNIFLLGVIILASFALMFYNGPYKRMANETNMNKLSRPLVTSSSATAAVIDEETNGDSTSYHSVLTLGDEDTTINALVSLLPIHSQLSYSASYQHRRHGNHSSSHNNRGSSSYSSHSYTTAIGIGNNSKNIRMKQSGAAMLTRIDDGSYDELAITDNDDNETGSSGGNKNDSSSTTTVSSGNGGYMNGYDVPNSHHSSMKIWSNPGDNNNFSYEDCSSPFSFVSYPSTATSPVRQPAYYAPKNPVKKDVDTNS